MRSTPLVACSLLSFLLVAAPVVAQTPRDALLVSPSWVAAHMHDANTILLHVGDPKNYPAKHLAGARLIQMADVSVSDHSGMQMPAGLPPEPLTGPKNGLLLEMPTADQLRSQFSKFGISDNTKIIIYSADEWISPTTRVVFTLDYAGLGWQSSLLDGGMQQWIAAGQPVTKAISASRTGSLAPLRINPIVVDAAWVGSHLHSPKIAIVDGRASSFYDGIEATGDRKGHIPGARSVPFTEIADDKNFIRSPDQLKALFARAGIAPDDTIVGYCHIGQQATAMLFAARLVGHPVKLYDGSMQEWSRRTDLPVALR